jgi:Domain of unknown function (DUF4124)
MLKNATVLRSILASLLLISLASFAQAQWSWKDKDGRRMFSDQPPPTSVPEKDILKRPPGAKAQTTAAVDVKTDAVPPDAAAGTSADAKTAAPKISGKDSELEKKKKEADTKEAAQKKAEAEKVSVAKKDNCERAKRNKASFDSGVRISTTNAKGEREIMNESTRAQETKRLQDIIASDCS